MMNIQLVESLVTIINSLSVEEQTLLKEHLTRPANQAAQQYKNTWIEQQKKLQQIHTKIASRRGEAVSDLGLAGYIAICRDERTA